MGPEVEGVAGAAALEAVEGVLLEVDGEAAAGAGGRAVQRAGAALLARRGCCEAWKPSSRRTAAMVMAARTAAKSMAGRDGSALALPSCSCRVCRSCLRRSRASASLRSRAAKICCVAAVELVLGRDVADGAVQADGVVVGDVIGHDAAGVVERQRHLDADAIALEGLVPAFDLAVGLRVVGRGSDMGHAGRCG